jgi:hypothetical protein
MFGHLPDVAQLRPGDLILFHALNPGFGSRTIIQVQKNGGHHQDDAKWHHAAVYVGEFQICEARLSGGVRLTYLYDYIGTHELRVRRDLALTAPDQWKLVIAALSKLQFSYGRMAAVRLWWQSQHGFWHPVQSYGDARAIICSQLYGDAYALITGRLLTKGRIGLPTPADLSLTSVLTDVQVDWVRLV